MYNAGMYHPWLSYFYSHALCSKEKDSFCTSVSYFHITTPYGPMIALADTNYLYALQFEVSNSCRDIIARLHRDPDTHVCLNERKSKLEPLLRKELNEYFAGTRTQFSIPYKLIGTPFQKSVWNALTKIPRSTTQTYQQIATAIGNTKSSRAVGNANNTNPISIIIPCHRVIGTNKKLTGYAAGLGIKQALLDLEGYKSA